MERIKPRTLSGFMELLPQQQILFEKILATLRETYELYGFTPLDTPVIESSEILLAKGGGETEKQIYRFQKGDSDLSLRFDLTVPLAKYVALNYSQLSFPFKRYQIGKVYRGERAQRGRFREFYQADIDIIGDGALDISNEAEIPSIIYRAFTSLGLQRFKIRFNNRKLLNGFFELMGLKDSAAGIMHAIDKLDKIGAAKVREILVDDEGIAADAADEILAFISAEDKLGTLQRYAGRSEMFDEGASELRIVAEMMQRYGIPADHFEIDFTIARGLDYYTGTVYETMMLDHPEIGSICSGGRYDHLAEHYTDKVLPGVGISIGVTRLFYVLGEQGYLNDAMGAAPADVLILPMGDTLGESIELASTLRAAGIRTQINNEKKKFKAKIGYADKLHIPYVIFMGEDEAKAGIVTLKNLATGEQAGLSAEDAAKTILAGLNTTNTVIVEPKKD
ncbi:MAG: histidine--tRNA ligase [Ruminococcaceae bacterium]|nr:histidine--tRNA ligase [Oscillospiraceae bacterium]